MSDEHEYLGIVIACPKEARKKGDIECYWIAPWTKPDSVKSIEPQIPVAPDLDEIVAIPAKDKKRDPN